MKQCKGKNGCDEYKDYTDFSKNKSTLDGLSRICKVCDNSKRKKHSLSKPSQSKSTKLKNRYDITLSEYTKMYLLQEGKCLICTTEYPTLCVDHNHDTGAVRGLLCKGCNIGIGFLKDNPMNMKRGMEYLLEKGLYG